MNKITRLFLLFFYPFLPFLAWMVFKVRDTPIDIIITLILIPIAFYILITPKINFPKYLVFFSLFTIYHLCSVYINHLIPPESNLLKTVLGDKNLVACLLFFVIENTHLDESFMRAMTRNIFIIVIISLIFSLVQVKFPTFFVAPYVIQNQGNQVFLNENRIFSIYSWVGLNSLGISFPILIAILLNYFSNKRFSTPFLLLCGIIVSFLTKARYVMISIIVVFSQLFFTSLIKMRKKVYILLIFFGCILISAGIARAMGYSVKQVIDERILERSSNFGSATARVISYYVFLQVFPEHPMFGVGPGTKTEVVRLLGGWAPFIHIGYLSYLYYYGLVGCFFFFLGLFYLLKYAWTMGAKYNFWGGFFGLLAFCLANVTMVDFELNEIGIVLIIIYFRYFKETSSLELVTESKEQTAESGDKEYPDIKAPVTY